MKTTNEIRAAFLKFFADRDHQIVNSSPLVPGNDPTLLFTNAGMVQFKDVFLGGEKRSYARATTSQRCLRAGGKHNDLDQVGYTARHHTFFEMLGNFSFGDYFKHDAIRYAWEFLTDVAGLPAEKLWVTVFEEDDEAAEIWLNEIGVPADRLSRIGAKDNFWAMGDTGPCGPCSEIFYDHGPEVAGGPPGTPDEDGDRYIEIWNLVFMQFDRDPAGNLTPLPKPCVDTGMGLERLAAVLQHVHSNYETDQFVTLIEAAAATTDCTDHSNKSLRVLADHIRACAFMIVDGVLPSNEGRGYVLRRIIRRAVRHGYMLGAREPFFTGLLDALCAEMGAAYPELLAKRNLVERLLKHEEVRFFETLENGMKLLEAVIADLSGTVIEGSVVFKLYDTYGFPVDLTADVARERGLTIDHAGFEAAMQEQREKGQKQSAFKSAHIETSALDAFEPTAFTGYDQTVTQATVAAIFADGKSIKQADEADGSVTIVLDRTPFYAESGGQVGDCGSLEGESGRLEVTDTQKIIGVHHGHIGTISRGYLSVGDPVAARIDADHRWRVVLNHSATHLLHAALREILGNHVEQKGSLVAADRLRFDFSHFEPMTDNEVRQVEDRVNEQIRANNEASARLMHFDEAMEHGAMALFGEKYGEEVRVLTFGDFSVELCGGTHVARTGDIGFFKITSEGGIASGVRRIEAVTGEAAQDFVRASQQVLADIGLALKAPADAALKKVQGLVERNRLLEKELERTKQQLASKSGDSLTEDATRVGGVAIAIAEIGGADAKALRETADKLKDKLGTAVILLGSARDGKVALVAGVTRDTTSRIKAGELVNVAAAEVGGRGGGRPDMAQAGGNDPARLTQALAAARVWCETRLAASAD